jgi:hypothetical protein
LPLTGELHDRLPNRIKPDTVYCRLEADELDESDGEARCLRLGYMCCNG